MYEKTNENNYDTSLYNDVAPIQSENEWKKKLAFETYWVGRIATGILEGSWKDKMWREGQMNKI